MSYACRDMMCGATDCQTCHPHSTKAVYCDDCGHLYEPEEGTEIADVGLVCLECLDDFPECDRCEEKFHESNLTWKNDKYYCEYCIEEV